jgi:hypothetical protein
MGVYFKAFRWFSPAYVWQPHPLMMYWWSTLQPDVQTVLLHGSTVCLAVLGVHVHH